ncbi:hypothetical protein ACH5RR_037705 [Cinchona calisaya]|uniref:NAC domain-containing protein n=1 Tax=Cinchona calisaya TaxID=153742 RepID=A0ABD2Y6Z4_9GENT
MESADSSTGQPQLPPGFRFHPTDEELVVHYLKKKIASAPLPASIIADVDLYKFDPWELPAKAIFGEQEWYFFSPRDRKYPNGARPNRAATSGYWKATGTDKPVLTSGGTQKVGVKKALVFYGGKPPKGIKTNWIMHEYRLAENKTSNNKPPGFDIANKKGSLRLDDWVLCRIYKKDNTPRPMDHERDDLNDSMMLSIPPLPPSIPNSKLQGLKASNFGALLENEQNMFEVHGMMMMMSSESNSISQLTSSGKAQQLPLFGNSSGSNDLLVLPSKRTIPEMHWNDEGTANSPPTKRFLGDHDGSDGRTNDDDDENNTANIATILMNQLPQTPATLHQQAMLGALGDGVFRQPNYHQVAGMNWYS